MSFDEPNKVFTGRTDIPEKLHPVCEKCIARCREKYSGFTADTGIYHEDGFAVECPYVPHDEVFYGDSLKNQIKQGNITIEDASFYNNAKSALLWAESSLLDPEAMVPWTAWPNQKEVLLCRAPYKVYRWGRRCLPVGTPILMGDGSWKNIEDVKPGELVASRTKYAQFRQKKILNFWENGEKEVFRITLSNGMWLDCTSNHPLFTYVERDTINHRGVLKKWMSIEDGLHKGMKVAVLNKYDRWGRESNKDLGKLIGYLVTDGYIAEDNQTPKFTNNNYEAIQEVQQISRRLFGYDCSIREKENGWDVYITDGDKGSANKLTACLNELGLSGLKSLDKFIPGWIYNWDKPSVMALINRIFSGDGDLYCHQKKDRKEGEKDVEISLSSTSYKMLNSVRLILLKVGVTSYINKDGVPNKKRGHLQQWKLRVSSVRSIQNFFDNVGLIYGKEDRCKEILEALKDKHLSKRGVFKHQKFVTIKSIESIGFQPTYDIEVEDTHNLVSNGIVSHNTGKSISLAIEILWFCLTVCGGEIRDPKTGKLKTTLNVLILAPQKTHIANIFDKVRAFISLVPEISTSQTRNVQGSPQVIAFGIGQSQVKISGFASGQGSGNEALGARGQDADLVVLDEAAFILPEIIQAVINPILYTKPHTRFIVSSTPSGIPGDWFESVCTKRPDFVEFYSPASVRPDWDQVEERVKRDFASSQEQWDKEVMALFSVAGEGVYKAELIKFGQVDITYGELGVNPNFVYTFGVDWNKEHGTEIVVLATQKGSPHVSLVVYAKNLPKKEWTNTLGTSRIAELNRIWQPAWIYVDAGGGEGGSILRDYGRSRAGKHMVDARLETIVKDYNFGQTFEIREANGKTKKVHAKPFMVEHSVHKFELQEVKFPRDDLTLQRQLENYIVERRSPVTGIPVYGVKEKKWGDHRLDALNLALVAVRLEFTSFYQDGVVPMAAGFAFFQDKTEDRVAKRSGASIGLGKASRLYEESRQPGNGRGIENVLKSHGRTPFGGKSGYRLPFSPGRRVRSGR